MLNPQSVVTGGASGLGRALCLEVAKRGGNVVVSDVDLVGAQETAHLVESAGAKAFVERCDVSKKEDVDALAEASRKHLGQIDLLCNNAGVAVSGPFEEISMEDWKWIVDINLWGVIYGCQAFLPAMRERRSGHVLNVASAAGLLRTANMSPYNVTKVGVVGLSETLNTEYKEHNVKVTALCPTFFKTNIMESGRGPEMKETRLAKKWMERSKVQAPDVARIALEDLTAGKIYSVPMADGKALWRLKRAAPEAFYTVLQKSTEWMQKRRR